MRPSTSEAGDARFAVLRQKNFVLYAVSRFFSTSGMTMQQALIAWQVYELAGDSPALQLGILGLIRFAPSLALSLVGGAVADSFNRRTITAVAEIAPLVCSIVLIVTTAGGATSIPLIYGLVLVIAVAAAFEFPARQALLPQIVTREEFPRAITVTSTFSQLGFISGPAAGGLLIASAGLEPAYGVHVALMAAAITTLLFLRLNREGAPGRRLSIEAIREGVSFVFQRQALLGAMAVDLVAVVFGGATALLPIYANDILHVGATGYGLLTASLEAGALVMAGALIMLPPVTRAGRALVFSGIAFGAATIVFGLSRSFPLSVAAYMVTGAADQISVVMRHTLIQLSTPDELRGRVSSVNSIFIGASNQLGAAESGLVAAATTPTFAVVSGGAGCVAAVALIATFLPELRRYRTTTAPVAAVVPGQDPAAVTAGTAGDLTTP